MPSRTLPFGLFELTLTVTMNISSSLTSSKSAYVRITQSGITANLVPLGSSMITSGSGQDLNFNPGLYSVDLDEDHFNASVSVFSVLLCTAQFDNRDLLKNWNYQYYCRIYGVWDFPHLNGSLLPLDDLQTDPLNPACLADRSSRVAMIVLKPSGHLSLSLNEVNIVTQSSKSAVMIRSGSFQSNRTYQLMIEMQNKQNYALKSIGSVLVRVQDTSSPMIVIG